VMVLEFFLTTCVSAVKYCFGCGAAALGLCGENYFAANSEERKIKRSGTEVSRIGTSLAKTRKDSATMIPSLRSSLPPSDATADGSPTTINTGDMVANRIVDDEILTVGQISKLLKLHQRTIYKLVRNGTIPGRRVGKWRFLRSKIMNFLVKRDD
jgi:excisionase family DNA binding protein